LATDWDFVAAAEEPEPPTYQRIGSSSEVPDLTGVTATATAGGQIAVEWTAPGQDFLYQVVRWRPVGGEWSVAPATAASAEFTITGLVDGGDYEVQAGNSLDPLPADLADVSWQPDPAIEVTAVANATAPAAVIGLSLTDVAGDVLVEWTAPNDGNYAGARVFRGTTTVLSEATLVRTEYGPPSSADAWTDAAPGTGTWRYWVAPINGSGVQGTASGPETITLA
jgi:hypothetical protein